MFIKVSLKSKILKTKILYSLSAFVSPYRSVGYHFFKLSDIRFAKQAFAGAVANDLANLFRRGSPDFEHGVTKYYFNGAIYRIRTDPSGLEDRYANRWTPILHVNYSALKYRASKSS